jgi:hypothetical protein
MRRRSESSRFRNCCVLRSRKLGAARLAEMQEVLAAFERSSFGYF